MIFNSRGGGSKFRYLICIVPSFLDGIGSGVSAGGSFQK